VTSLWSRRCPAPRQLELFTETLRQLLIGDYLLGDTLIHYPGASIGTVVIDPNEMNPDSALRCR
jgi:diguanylate cyclase